MRSRVFDLHRKEVVNIRDGTRIGNVGDVEIDTATASVLALVIYGKLRLFGLLGRQEDRVIPWTEIQIIGEDIILVDSPPMQKNKRKRWSTTGPGQPQKEAQP
jgi:YlmC/YmxH family sporulation protein